MAPALLRFDGWIGGASFASGDRFVVGWWPRSPFGAFADLMWARPDGSRVLIAPRGEILEFIGAHYMFDEHLTRDVRARVDPTGLSAGGGELELELVLGRPGTLSFLLAARPRALRMSRPWIAFEDAVLRRLVSPLLGGASTVRTRGRTRQGAREWYAMHDYRLAGSARGSVGGRGLGGVRAPSRPAGFGFSEFPRLPGVARVTSLIETG